MIPKTYKVLERDEQQQLSVLFQAIENFHYHGKRLVTYYSDTEEILKKNNYKWFYVSVFDRWLNHDNEADKELLEEFFKFEDISHPKSSLLSAFNLKLFQSTLVLNFRPIGKKNHYEYYGRKQKISFRKFLSFEKFKLVSGTPQNYLFPYLVLPDLKAIYFPGKDLTHLLIYRDENLLHDFKNWIADANLYILYKD